MNAVTKVANGAWSLLCISVMFGLLGMAAYWSVIQQPISAFEVPASPASSEYLVTAGSIVYFDNTLKVEAGSSVTYDGKLLQNGQVRYTLAAPDDVPPQELDRARVSAATDSLGKPLYALFIPSYVTPGAYTYEATVSYRLNPFRSETVKLPPLTLIVQ